METFRYNKACALVRRTLLIASSVLYNVIVIHYAPIDVRRGACVERAEVVIFKLFVFWMGSIIIRSADRLLPRWHLVLIFGRISVGFFLFFFGSTQNINLLRASSSVVVHSSACIPSFLLFYSSTCLLVSSDRWYYHFLALFRMEYILQARTHSLKFASVLFSPSTDRFFDLLFIL